MMVWTRKENGMTNLIFLALSRLPYVKSGLTADIVASYFDPGAEERKEAGAGIVQKENADSAGEPDKAEGEEILYLSQMEPIVIWKASRYRKDKLIVIVLCTRDVLCTPFSPKDPVTAAEFFMTNVCGQLGKEIDITDYPRAFSRQSYMSGDHTLEFILIPVDEDHVNAGIAESIEEIRAWNSGGKGKRGHFWIDTHGGFRSTMTVMAGILSLLKIDGIIPDNIYSSRYSNSVMILSNEEETFTVFDFVAGMNDFINFGSADVLRSYFARRQSTPAEKTILASIDKIAMGTQCCDTISYKQGLTELSETLADPDLHLDSLLGIFLEYIRSSYGDLLNKKKRSTLLIVRRCVEKKLYQQALTFIEASMPEEIVTKKLLEFDIRNYQLPEVTGNRDGDANYYLLDAFLKMGGMYPLKSRCTLKQKVERYAKCETELRKALRGERFRLPDIDTWLNTADRNNAFPFDQVRETYDYSLPETLYGINTKIPEKDRDVLGIFLRMHQLLKQCRNAFNHGLQDRPELPGLLVLFDLYLDYAEYLYQRV